MLAEATGERVRPIDSRASPSQHGPAGKWPTTIGRDRALAGGPRARVKGEEAQRAKWLAELQQLVLASHLPVMEVASRMKDPIVLLSALGKGRRWRTLKR